MSDLIEASSPAADPEIRELLLSKLSAEIDLVRSQQVKTETETHRLSGACLEPQELAERLNWLANRIAFLFSRLFNEFKIDRVRAAALHSQTSLNVLWLLQEVSRGNLDLHDVDRRFQAAFERRGPSHTKPSGNDFFETGSLSWFTKQLERYEGRS